MSFSSEVKEELCRIPLEDLACARAEAYGVLLFCNSFGPNGIRISTQSAGFAARLPGLFQMAFGVAFDQQPQRYDGEHKQIFRVTRRASIARILETFGYSTESVISHHINYAVLEEEAAMVAFCRGAFLAGGSVTDPAKRYHLEMATNHLYVHREFQALLPELQLRPRATQRKANYLTYLKQNDAIALFLTAIGAPNAARQVVHARQEKKLFNGVNRQYNCDVANVEKAVAAAQTQIEAIRRLRELGDLEHLPEKLQETARVREAHPELSLAELAQICTPPVSKSCLNHRLRKLQGLAAGRE